MRAHTSAPAAAPTDQTPSHTPDSSASASEGAQGSQVMVICVDCPTNFEGTCTTAEAQRALLGSISSAIGAENASGTSATCVIPSKAVEESEAVAEALAVASEGKNGAVYGSGDVALDSRIAASLGIPVVLFIKEGNDALRIGRALATARGEGAHVAAVVSKTGTVAGEYDAPVAEPSDADTISSALAAAGTLTPLIGPEVFQRQLMDQARSAGARIVLPEGDDDRILIAADAIAKQKVCELIILGDPERIQQRCDELNLDLGSVTIANPDGTDQESIDQHERFAQEFAELRKKKGVTIEQARETMKDISYYATMMIHLGLADGMVSGAAHTTAHTIRPAFQIIKTAPGSSVVSSIFLMVLRGNLWAFGDCAVNPNPTPEQLAEIAVASARTASGFGIDPRVAMLSYSTGESGTGEDVDAVVAAVKAAQEAAPDLAIDGPIQFDAAVVAAVGEKKMPGSAVAGQANVFVFPDLNSGNIGYKAVQRTANALAVGPVLQGLNKPVNDLSRGATVADIINTVAITAVQAGQKH